MKKIYIEQYIIGYQPSEWHFQHLFSFGVIEFGKMSIGVGGYGRPSKLNCLWVYDKKMEWISQKFPKGIRHKYFGSPTSTLYTYVYTNHINIFI